jgi:hypothetical protein
MNKRLSALILAFAMLFVLTACSASSSSTSTTSVSTSVTDAEGNTTTNTVINETGVSAGPEGVQTKDETTTETVTAGTEESVAEDSMAAFFPPKEEWFEIYSEGGEGANEEGDRFYFAFNDPDNVTYAMILIAFADGAITVRNGEVVVDEENNCLQIIDEEMNVAIPFVFLDTEEEGTFAIRFLANDTEVLFKYVDQDIIISDIYGILSTSVSNSQTAAADGDL